MSASDIVKNFALLDFQVQVQGESVSVLAQVKASGELLVGNGTGPDTLDPTTGLDGQLLVRDTLSTKGIKWASASGIAPSGVTPGIYNNGTFTVDVNGMITNASNGNINNVTPTVDKGDIMVETGLEVVNLPVGANGTFLGADSSQSTGLKWSTLSYDTIKPSTALGDLVTEDGVGAAVLALGTNNQHLVVDLAEATGMKWTTQVFPEAPTLEDLTPTSTTGDLIVQDNVGDMARLPIGAANDGDVLTVDSATTATKLIWAAPSGGGGGGPYNVVENVSSGGAIVVNIVLVTYPHNTIFMINSNGNFGTIFTYNLPAITIAEQGSVYRFGVVEDDTATGTWTVVPDGSDVIEFSSYVDSGFPQKVSNFQSTAGDPLAFNIQTSDSVSAMYGAGVSLMAFFSSTGNHKWISIGVGTSVTGPSGGGG
jgi:hypothetical protein